MNPTPSVLIAAVNRNMRYVNFSFATFLDIQRDIWQRTWLITQPGHVDTNAREDVGSVNTWYGIFLISVTVSEHSWWKVQLSLERI